MLILDTNHCGVFSFEENIISVPDSETRLLIPVKRNLGTLIISLCFFESTTNEMIKFWRMIAWLIRTLTLHYQREYYFHIRQYYKYIKITI